MLSSIYIMFSRVMLSLPLIFFMSGYNQILYSQIISKSKIESQLTHKQLKPTSTSIFSIKLQLDDTTTTLQGLQVQPKKCYVLVWFSPTCPICLKSLPALEKLNSTYQQKEVEFVLISPDSSLSTNDIIQFKKSTSCTIPLLVDTKQELTSALSAKVTPQAIVVNSLGNVIYSGKIDNLFERLGVKRRIVTKHYVQDAIESILNNTPLSERTTTPVGCIIERYK